MGVDAVRAGIGTGGFVFLVDAESRRDRLGIISIDGLAFVQAQVEVSRHIDGAHFGAFPAARALIQHNVARMMVELESKISRFAGYALDGGPCQNVDVPMRGNFNQLGAHHARRTIIGRKGLVKL